MSARALAAVRATPSGPAFTVVLVLHVAAVLIGLLALTVSVLAAGRLLGRRQGPLPATVLTYFAPGVNWAGRTLWLVPVLGAALVEMSAGAFGFADAWVLEGLGLWAVAVVVAEGVLWPAERRVQRALVAAAPDPVPARCAPDPVADGATGPVADGASERGVGVEAVRGARTICWSGAVVAGALVAAMVVMFAKP